MAERKRGRGKPPRVVGVDENGNEILGNGGGGRQQRYTSVSFTVNMPDGVDSPVPFALLTGVFQQWQAQSDASIMIGETKWKVGIPHVTTSLITHYAWQWERGEANGRLHIQGCIAFASRIYLTVVLGLFALLPDGPEKRMHPHIEAVHSDYRTMVEYCTKKNDDTRWPGKGGRIAEMADPVIWCKNADEDPMSVASTIGQGHRTDLEELHQQLLTGRRVEDLILDTHYGPQLAKVGNWAQSVQAARDRRNTEDKLFMKEVFVYWGETGTNKTRRVLHETRMKYGNARNLYIHTMSGKFWDGYVGQEDILLDEVSNKSLERAQIDITMMLRILDIYQVRVEVKCSIAWLQATRVFITSNQDPDMWFPQISSAHRAALARRITKTEHFETAWIPENGW